MHNETDAAFMTRVKLEAAVRAVKTGKYSHYVITRNYVIEEWDGTKNRVRLMLGARTAEGYLSATPGNAVIQYADGVTHAMSAAYLESILVG